jgi:hypothetical protein
MQRGPANSVLPFLAERSARMPVATGVATGHLFHRNPKPTTTTTVQRNNDPT